MTLNFKIPRDLDNLLWYNFTFLIVIAFLSMQFANGEVQLKYIENFNPSNMPNVTTQNNNFGIFNISINYSLEDTNNKNIGQLMEYKNNIIKQNYRIPYINLFIYWILMPLIDCIYLIWFYFFRKKEILALQ
jgi:hypothetical protein